MTQYDYTSLLKGDNEHFSSWEEIYDPDKSLPENFLTILKRAVYLPCDHYKIVTAYAFIPSVFARVVPYLFLYGVSGSGKSTIGKLVSYLHGITITSSSDTFAAIRNRLESRRTAEIFVESNDPAFPGGHLKVVPANTFMVWDDIDTATFLSNNDIYRLFKFGYDKSCDTIEISSIESGKNLKFRCFSPKIFSSIHPIHLNSQLKELQRRLIVIPTKRIEDIPTSRQMDLGLDINTWEELTIDIDSYSWKGFDEAFKEFWDIEMAQMYLLNRKELPRYLKGFKSFRRIISVDLIVTGVTIGIWNNEGEAIEELKTYYSWLDKELKIGEAPLSQLLKNLITTEQENKTYNGEALTISNQQVRAYCDTWYLQGQLLDKPTPKIIRDTMSELGYRLVVGGKWIKS